MNKISLKTMYYASTFKILFQKRFYNFLSFLFSLLFSSPLWSCWVFLLLFFFFKRLGLMYPGLQNPLFKTAIKQQYFQ